MGHVIPEMNTHVWKALDRFLQKYYELLQRRCDLHTGKGRLSKVRAVPTT